MRLAPYFLDTFPASRRPSFPKLRGRRDTRVVIVGGGLAGCACAASFAAAGVPVVLLEAARIGAGATGSSAGMARQDLNASFQQAAARHGVGTARHLWQASRRASLDFTAALRRWKIRADAAEQDLIWFTRSGPEQHRILQRESRARREAGLDAAWLTSKALASALNISADGGFRVRAEAFDPYRACIGLATFAAAKGAEMFEHSEAIHLKPGAKTITIKSGDAEVTARTLVIASGRLPDDLRALRRHFDARQTCSVVTAPLPAVVRRDVGSQRSALEDTASPSHLLRWMKDDRVLFSGAELPALPERSRPRQVVPRANELMYELSTIYPAISGVQPQWAWETVHYESPDGLPVIGPHRNFPRQLFALGLGTHGPGVAWLAARTLLRTYLGESEKEDESLGFARIL